MTYGELKIYLRNLINRTDLTDSLAEQFIQQSQDRLERLVRASFMERYLEFTLDGTGGDFRVPADFLELINLFTDCGKLRRVNLDDWLSTDPGVGVPRVFMQTGHALRMRPIPSADTTLTLHYYGTEPELTGPDDENYWSRACVDAFVYAAASLAGDYFEDERLQEFEGKFQSALAEIKDQQEGEDFSGPMTIRPAYSYQD